MDIFASRETIVHQAFEAARSRLGADGNPWPAGTDARAVWQDEYDRLVGGIEAEAA